MSLAVPAALFADRDLTKYKVFVGRWVPFSELVWVLPIAWLLLFAVFALIPSIYDTYSSDIKTIQSAAEDAARRQTEKIDTLERAVKRPHLIPAYGANLSQERTGERILYLRNLGEGHARDVQIAPITIGNLDVRFDRVHLVESGQEAMVPLTWTRDGHFAPVFGRDFVRFIEDVLGAIPPEAWADEITVTVITLTYWDMSGRELSAQWDVVVDRMHAALDHYDEMLSFRERGFGANRKPLPAAV